MVIMMAIVMTGYALLQRRALHRELAANVSWDVTGMAGTAADRNVELRVTPPFPLKRLPGA
jgi:hypothetical protein